MKKKNSALLSLLIFLFLINNPFLNGQTPSYPETRCVQQIDDYHGVKISDPYRWLEDTDSEEVQAWMKEQDKALKNFLDQDAAAAILQNSIQRFGKTGDNYSVPQIGGDYYFYTIGKPSLDHALIYSQNGREGTPRLLLDMNKELEEGEHFGGFSVCPNGRFITIRTRQGQERYGKLRIYNVEEENWSGEILTGTTTARVAWTYSNGFYYLYYGESAALNEEKIAPHSQIKYHRIKSRQSKDLLVMEASKNKDEPVLLYTINSSHDYQHLIVKTRQGRGDKNKLYAVSVQDHKIFPLVETADHMFNYVGSKGSRFFFYTNQAAPNGKVIAIEKEAAGQDHWQIIIPEQKETLAGGSTAGGNAMNLIGDRFTLLYREGTQTEIRVFDLDGQFRYSVPLETGWIGSGLVGVPDGNEVWFSLNTFLSPSNIYRMDLKTGNSEVFFDRGLPLQREDYIVENTYYRSFDGTKVPIYICYKKQLKRDGSNPVFMYGYGFGGWVATPWYQPQLLTFLEMGGIYVLPGVRGGGEFGDAWRDAGVKLNRQNAISDYISAAEYLVEQGYTSPGKIAANGWSASGSLAAAVALQRPDLFGAAMIGIPSLDMLRYEKFTAFKGWTSGYGSPDVQEEFLNLYRWSPYHNIKSNTCYPAMLVTVGEKDPTTPPEHGYKFIAALQAQQAACPQPALLKIVWGGGHGFGVTSEQVEETQTQELSFLVKVLGMDVTQN